MPDFCAVLDSCVLFPNLLRDTLLSAAEAGLYRAYWSPLILEGLSCNLVARQILTQEKASYLEQLLRSYFAEAMVEVSPEQVAQMTNHPGDRHVLAAAVQAQAQVIVTFNLKHFPSSSTRPWGIEAQHPDPFLLSLLAENSSLMVDTISQQALRFRRPPLSVDQLLTMLAQPVPRFVTALRESFNQSDYLT